MEVKWYKIWQKSIPREQQNQNKEMFMKLCLETLRYFLKGYLPTTTNLHNIKNQLYI